MRASRSGVLALALGIMVLLSACARGGALARPPTVSSTVTAQIASGTHIAESVLQRLKANDLPIGETFTATTATDPDHLLGTPGQYVGKVTFQDTRLAKDLHGADLSVVDGGSILVYPSALDVKNVKDYMQKLNGDGAMFFTEYDYWNGLVLLRLSSQLSPSQAGDYKAVLAAMPAVSQLTSAPPAGAGNG